MYIARYVFSNLLLKLRLRIIYKYFRYTDFISVYIIIKVTKKKLGEWPTMGNRPIFYWGSILINLTLVILIIIIGGTKIIGTHAINSLKGLRGNALQASQ